uniref:Uncharacterized protein n=1 Tax=Cucumis sativus TaxID=3659 RepID=A0A0A0KKZ9_CUCSA
MIGFPAELLSRGLQLSFKHFGASELKTEFNLRNSDYPVHYEDSLHSSIDTSLQWELLIWRRRKCISET